MKTTISPPQLQVLTPSVMMLSLELRGSYRVAVGMKTIAKAGKIWEICGEDLKYPIKTKDLNLGFGVENGPLASYTMTRFFWILFGTDMMSFKMLRDRTARGCHDLMDGDMIGLNGMHISNTDIPCYPYLIEYMYSKTVSQLGMWCVNMFGYAFRV